MPHSNTLLIVDDEPAILETYKDYLVPRSAPVFRSARMRTAEPTPLAAPATDYRILLAASGREALDLVESELREGRRIAGGFFDMLMPGMDGLETMRRIRDLDESVLCTVVTAFQDRSIDVINELFTGHEDEWDYINKPFTRAEIRQKARQLVSSWNRRRREEQQRTDLESLIHHVSLLRDFQQDDTMRFIAYVLRQLVEFTGSAGGFVATAADGDLEFLTGVGSTASAGTALSLLERQAVCAQLARQGAEVEFIDDLALVPMTCVRSRQLFVLVDDGGLQQRKDLVRVFAENAAAAISRQQVMGELIDLNRSLEDRVQRRTAELAEINAELTRALRELKDTEQQLVQREKLAVVGQLATSVAHEINNPSAYIQLNLRFLADALGSFHELADKLEATEGGSSQDIVALLDEFQACLDECNDGVNRITKIVTDLRGFGRADSDDKELVDLRGVLHRVVRILGRDIRQRAKLDLQLLDQAMVLGIKGRLLQVFINLVVNAMQAMEGPASDNHLRISLVRDGPWYRVEIEDTGCGIPAELLDKIFDPFVTTKPEGVGTGLGLSICKRIVTEDHGGTLTVESTPGVGTTFVCTLLADETQRARPPKRASTTKGAAARRILVVDDDAMLLRAIKRHLTTQGHDVVTANGGEAAIALLAEDRSFDCILCDLMMPDVRGWQVRDRATDLDPDLDERFLFFTGGAFTEEGQRFVAANEDRCISKPVDFAVLADKLEALPRS